MTGSNYERKFQVMINDAMYNEVERITNMLGMSRPIAQRKIIGIGTAGCRLIMGEYTPPEQIRSEVDKMSDKTRRLWLQELISRFPEWEIHKMRRHRDEQMIYDKAMSGVPSKALPSNRHKLPNVYDPWTVRDLNTQSLRDLNILEIELAHKQAQVYTYTSLVASTRMHQHPYIYNYMTRGEELNAKRNLEPLYRRDLKEMEPAIKAGRMTPMPADIKEGMERSRRYAATLGAPV